MRVRCWLSRVLLLLLLVMSAGQRGRLGWFGFVRRDELLPKRDRAKGCTLSTVRG